MRYQLETDLVNALIPYRDLIPIEDIKTQYTIILDNYEIEARKTEIIVRDEDKNNKLIALFLASKAAGGRTERTINTYKNYLIKQFNAINKSADEVTSDDIKLYLAKKLRMDKCTKVSTDNERRVLSTFYSWMQKNEYIAKNPMDKVELMKYSKPKKKAFTDMEVEQIRAACRSEREKAIVEIMMSTWCRVSELCAIRIEELETDKVVVHGKGEKDRTVFLNAKAQLAIAQYLERRHDNNPYLFPRSAAVGNVTAFTKNKKRITMSKWYEDPDLVSESEPCDKGSIENIVRNLGKRAKVKNVHPHRFRRTGATFALRANMPIMTISKLLGHANVAVTQVYLDIDIENLESEHNKYVR